MLLRKIPIKMVEAGGVGIFRALKTRKLLILLDAQNSRNAEIAPNWNVSGTRLAKKRSGAAAELWQLLNQRCDRSSGRFCLA